MPPNTRLSTVSFRHAEGRDCISLDVHEFVSLAAASKWIVVSDVPDSDKVFMCCPSLQPTMLSEHEHVRLIKESGFMKLLVVDDMSNTKYAAFTDGFLQEEDAFVSMLSLLKQEKRKGKKKKRQGQKIRESVPMEDSFIEVVTSAATETVVTQPTDTDAGIATTQDADKDGAQSTDEIFFVDGKIIVQGKPKSSLELLADIWVQVKEHSKVLRSVQDDLKGVQDDLKGLHKSLSQVAERGCRSNLALMYRDFVGNDAQLIQPIVTRWFPYDEMQMGKQGLEHLALLYQREGEKVEKSGLVEVDMLLKVVVGGLESRTSPNYVESSQVSARASQREFSHLIIGEYSRSTMLCAHAIDYEHPLQPSRSSSAKLLYKLIQVERGATAATQYYATGDHIIDAAAIMSPSFKRLSDPELLIRKVLSHVNGELPIVERLLSQGKMWLLDL